MQFYSFSFVSTQTLDIRPWLNLFAGRKINHLYPLREALSIISRKEWNSAWDLSYFMMDSVFQCRNRCTWRAIPNSLHLRLLQIASNSTLVKVQEEWPFVCWAGVKSYDQPSYSPIICSAGFWLLKCLNLLLKHWICFIRILWHITDVLFDDKRDNTT